MKLEIKNKLLTLLRRREFLSYEKIAKNLNISHSTIWKQIKSLKEFGYEIEFVKNKGYRLISKLDMIIPEDITRELDTHFIGKDVFYFGHISSTNTYAKQIAEEGIREGTVIIADIQTHGRGRKNRAWFSPIGGLWFSIVLRPKILPDRGMFVTMLASIAVVQAVKEITGLDPVIKWPNDILINGKKICGILSEIDVKKNIVNYVIVGIGINVNNVIKDELKNTATSISMEVGSDISRVKLLKLVLKYFEKNYIKLDLGDYDSIKKLWSSYAKITGKQVKIKDNGNTILGTIVDLDEKGYLILKTNDGIRKVFNGDIYYL